MFGSFDVKYNCDQVSVMNLDTNKLQFQQQ